MAKVIKFPEAVPEKFGVQRVRKNRDSDREKPGQLNLFTSAKIIHLNRLTPFEEALMVDERGDLEAAQDLYKKAIDQNDVPADSYCNLGIIQFQRKEYPKAINSFTSCLKLEPRHFEAHYNLANLYAEVGNLELAKLHYQASVEIEPSFVNSYFNLALTLAMNKEYREAIDILFQYRDLTGDEDHQQVDHLIATLQRTIGS